MSPAAREADKAWLGTLWDAYQDDVTRARQLPDNALDDYIGHLVSNLKAHDGDTAKLALDAGLVDKLANRDEMRSRLIEVVGEDSDTHSFKQIDFHDYLKSVKAQGKFEHYSANKIGVIVASGTIVNGDQPPGGIGGDSTAELIRRARFDKSIKAIVLRVDSGGGSAFASEIIRHELELTRKAGKPVIVSMGSVAASGGYWISMAGDEIFARPTTITGSIGILGMFPTFQRTLEWAGVHNDGVGTTPLSGALRPDRAMTPEMKQAFQMAIDHGYQEFIHHVAAAREMPVAEVDKIARGRVWSGLDAERLGLVDKLGGFDDAVKAAADKAGVGDDYQLKYVRKPLTPRQQFLLNLLNGSHALVGSVQAPPKPDLPYAQLQRTLARQVKLLSQLNDPRGVYAYCFCRTN
jgi:protease-4